MNKLKEDSVLEGTIEFTNNGNASIKMGERSIFIFKKNTLNALNQDKVKVKTIIRNKKLEGVVTEVLERSRTRFVGKIHKNKNNIFVILDSQKVSVDFYVKGKPDVEDNEKVLIELIGWEVGSKSPKCKVIEVLGKSGENNAEMNSIMFEYGLPNEFPLIVEADAEMIPFEISENEISKRRDMRNVSTFTIDPADAKDFDDAISVDIINDNEVEVGIHIADVSHYIREDGEIDKEAVKRATSVYLVDRCVPMLPERLSNGVCSLRPNEEKLCFSVVVKLDRDGNLLDTWFGKTVIESDRRFSYEEAQEIIEGTPGDYQKEILFIDDIAKKIRRKRIDTGSIEMGGIEVKFKLDEITKKPTGVYFKQQKDANKLIEEYMLLANRLVAKELKNKLKICVNRAHGEPNTEKLEEIKKLTSTLGYDFNINKDNITECINTLIKDVKDTPHETLINTLIIRSQQKAIYTTNNIGHYGLGFEDYCHFTSPIRRYADNLVHRLLALTLGNGGYPIK